MVQSGTYNFSFAADHSNTLIRLIILATITIYLRAGKDIYLKRQKLQAFHDPSLHDTMPPIDPFTICRTTEVMVTSATVTSADTINLQQPGGPSQDPRWPDLEKLHSPAQQTTRNKPTSRDFNFPITSQVSNSAFPTPRPAASEANTAAWSYTKVAVLFFVAMMVTWIPSSANRVYSVLHPAHVSLPLQFASAFVLPLQGFWNALIYTTTSLPACKQLWKQVRERIVIMRGNGLKTMTWPFGDGRDREAWPKRLTMRSSQKFSLEGSESMTELQTSRRVTKDTSSR